MAVIIVCVLLLARRELRQMKKNLGFLLVFLFLFSNIYSVILTFVWLENTCLRKASKDSFVDKDVERCFPERIH